LAKTSPRLYLIPVLSKALDIFELLQSQNQSMTLDAIHRRTRISKTTVYRVLKTFMHRGYVSQGQDGFAAEVSAWAATLLGKVSEYAVTSGFSGTDAALERPRCTGAIC